MFFFKFLPTHIKHILLKVVQIQRLAKLMRILNEGAFQVIHIETLDLPIMVFIKVQKMHQTSQKERMRVIKPKNALFLLYFQVC